jgi:hypothetical protein
VRAALLTGQNIMQIRGDSEAAGDHGLDPAGKPYPCYTFFNSSIDVTSSFARFGPLCQAAMILHEPVHYVDGAANTANDFYEHGSSY